MFHLGGLAQKSSEGRVGMARGSIGFFARGPRPFLVHFLGGAAKASKKEQKGKIRFRSIKFGFCKLIFLKHVLKNTKDSPGAAVVIQKRE